MRRPYFSSIFFRRRPRFGKKTAKSECSRLVTGLWRLPGRSRHWFCVNLRKMYAKNIFKHKNNRYLEKKQLFCTPVTNKQQNT